MAAAISALRSELADQQGQLARQATETERYRRELDAVLGSTAWRSTSIPRRLSAACPAWAKQLVRRIIKAAWWTATPWRVPARLAFLKQRRETVARERNPVVPVSTGVATPRERVAPASRLTASDPAYASWIETYETADEGHDAGSVAAGKPRLSFLLTGSDPALAQRTADSLIRQSSPGWQVVSGFGGGIGLHDERFVFVPEAAHADRAEALSIMSRHATGDWIAVLDAGDILASHAAYEIIAAATGTADAAIIYSDEDELGPDGARQNPYLKPSWSPQLLQAFNYFGRLAVLSREVLDLSSGFLPVDGAAAEWSANLRAADAATAAGRRILRLTQVLCHRAPGGDRERPRPATRAAAHNRDMLRRYWATKGIQVRVETMIDGAQHAIWSPASPPLVSVVIPNHENPALLRKCLQGILQDTGYPNLEVIIVENNSTSTQIWDFYRELDDDKRVRILRRDGPFNYSAVCNAGASVARGELLLFLNNDIEVVRSDWLMELVCAASLPSVGVVGAKLRYPDGRLQHAGVVAGVHLFGLAYHSCDEHIWGVFGSPGHTRNWLAVMGACQMVRREVFDLVGGFDESYEIANSDVALCVEAHLAGWRTVYTPFAELIHHEGFTRGRSNPLRDMIRSAELLERVGMPIDPYLHPGLSGMDGTLRLRAMGEPSLLEMTRANVATFMAEGRGAGAVEPA